MKRVTHSSQARSVIAHIANDRRLRIETFGKKFAEEAAWEIVLNLFVGKQSQQRLSVMELARLVDAPDTTVHRWLALLERRGIVTRERDIVDRRKFLLGLSDWAAEDIIAYLDKRFPHRPPT